MRTTSGKAVSRVLVRTADQPRASVRHAARSRRGRASMLGSLAACGLWLFALDSAAQPAPSAPEAPPPQYPPWNPAAPGAAPAPTAPQQPYPPQPGQAQPYPQQPPAQPYPQQPPAQPYPQQPPAQPYPPQPGQAQPYPPQQPAPQPYPQQPPQQQQPAPPQPGQAQPYPQQQQQQQSPPPYPAQPEQGQPYPPQPEQAPAYPPQTYPQNQAPAYPQQSEATMGPGLEPPPVDAGNEGETEAHQDAAGVDEESAWYDELKLGAFVDGYAGINLSTPKPQLGRNRFHAYNLANGFSLAWGGLDVEYGAQEFAGTLSLRFGPSASALAGGDAEHGLENVKQAFASWRPSSKFSLDFGKFDTIYGAEVADSQANFNYTRGLLYWLGQPVFHTGLRAAIDISPQFWITALAVNGWNNTIDNNSGKTFGVQFSTSIPRGSDETPLLDVHLGYLAGPEQRDYGVLTDYCPPGETFNPGSGACDASNPASSPTVQRDAGAANNVEAFRHFIDLVANFHPSNDLSLLLNFDVGFEGTRVGSPDDYGALNEFDGQSWWGLAVGARYAFSPVWAGALRGEVFGDPDARATSGDDPHVNDVQDLMLYSGTLTIEAAPSDNLLFRLDARLDGANEAVFPRQLRSYEQIQPTLVLGVVATTN